MKYALGLVESYGNDFKKNLMSIEKTLMKTKEQRVELLLFSELFLGELNFTEESLGFFQLKMLAVNYDVPFGIGLMLENHNSYVVFDKDGSLLLKHRVGNSETFELNHREFSVVLGDEGFDIENPRSSLVLWPILINSSPQEWFNEVMSKYRLQCKNLGSEVILINGVRPEMSYGGGFYLKNQQFVLNQPMEQIGLSIFDD